MASSAELLADSADIDSITFGTHAHAHFAVGQFFEEHSHNDAVKRYRVGLMGVTL